MNYRSAICADISLELLGPPPGPIFMCAKMIDRSHSHARSSGPKANKLVSAWDHADNCARQGEGELGSFCEGHVRGFSDCGAHPWNNAHSDYSGGREGVTNGHLHIPLPGSWRVEPFAGDLSNQ